MQWHHCHPLMPHRVVVMNPKVVIVSLFYHTGGVGRHLSLLLLVGLWFNDIVQELLKHGASVNVQDSVSQRPCTVTHLCEVLHSVFCWLYGMYRSSGIIVELYCCALHTDTTVWHDVYCTLWTEVDWAHLHMYTHICTCTCNRHGCTWWDGTVLYILC